MTGVANFAIAPPHPFEFTSQVPPVNDFHAFSTAFAFHVFKSDQQHAPLSSLDRERLGSAATRATPTSRLRRYRDRLARLHLSRPVTAVAKWFEGQRPADQQANFGSAQPAN